MPSGNYAYDKSGLMNTRHFRVRIFIPDNAENSSVKSTPEILSVVLAKVFYRSQAHDLLGVSTVREYVGAEHTAYMASSCGTLIRENLYSAVNVSPFAGSRHNAYMLSRRVAMIPQLVTEGYLGVVASKGYRGWQRYLLDFDPWPVVRQRREPGEPVTFSRRVGTIFHFVGGTLGEPSGDPGRNESADRCKGLPEHDPGLVVGNQKCLFGRVRRAGTIVQGFCAGLFGILCILASFSLYRTFRGREPVQIPWIALYASSLVGLVWCAGALITGYVWLPWT